MIERYIIEKRLITLLDRTLGSNHTLYSKLLRDKDFLTFLSRANEISPLKKPAQVAICIATYEKIKFSD